MFPSEIPDLSSESPLIVSGRYHGEFPETLKVNGVLADMTNFHLDLKVEEAKEMPIGKVSTVIFCCREYFLFVWVDLVVRADLLLVCLTALLLMT